MNLEKKEEKQKIKLKGSKRLRKHVWICLTFIVAILIMGFIYEKIGAYKDNEKYVPVGKIVELNSRKISVFSKGEGKITVVFGSGLNTPSTYSDFYPIYNEISKYAKIVTYDRPGHGWSEVTDEPRDIDTIVKEMHTVLEKSGQKPPYILVGHSYASLQAIRFAQTYKNEVSGVMLIDGVNPEYYAKNGSEISSGTVAKYKFLKSVGIARLILNHTDLYSKNFKSLPDDLEQLYFGMFLKTMFNKNIVEEGKMGKASAKLIIANGHLGSLPLRILSAPSDIEWNDSQVALKEWSEDSEQIIVNGARHAIHQSNPEVVSEQIKKLLENNK